MQENPMNTDELEIDLVKIVKTCWTRLWLILLAAVLVGGAMFAYGKLTYVPQYRATTTMYAHFDSPESSIDALTGTCTALLKTRAVLGEVAGAAGLEISHSKLSGMISVEAVTKSPLFKIRVTGADPEEAARIANAAAEVLSDTVASVYANSNVGVIDAALVPSAPVADKTVKNAAVAAVLSAMAVCGILATRVIYIDWVALKNRKEQ